MWGRCLHLNPYPSIPAPHQELQTEEIDRETGQLDHLAWADQGRLLSVSTRSGNLYTFVLRTLEGRCRV